ncbi:ABC transporter permease [Solihabitans fulvus]|uniref:ABC transporter permease n=1 Tax=Solihabitans fulvus TaxID=1892852 RepID=A0A5B2XPB5_9PSEU|nr:ABC transporter permease [Solihabitans fulvus]KAA2265213.1 ABC transporter permease [Solihabitans fulvus]
MSTTTMAAPTPARIRNLFAAEWTKLWSLRSTYWVLGVGTLLMIAASITDAIRTTSRWSELMEDLRARFDPMSVVLGAPSAALLMLGASSVGVLVVAGEYSSGLIRTTFTAVPDRRRVVLAKVGVVAGTMLLVGVVIATISFFASQAVLSSVTAGVSIGDPAVLRSLASDALLAPVAALVGMAIAALLRHTAASVITSCVVLVIVPSFFKITVYPWVDDIYNAFPLYVWRNCLSMLDPITRPYFPTVTGSWIVFAAWPLVGIVVTAVIVHRRDV